METGYSAKTIIESPRHKIFIHHIIILQGNRGHRLENYAIPFHLETSAGGKNSYELK